jgi:hypothetical protein
MVVKKRRGRRLFAGFAALAMVVGIFIAAGTALAVHEFDMQLDGDVSTHAYSVPGTQTIDWGGTTCNVADTVAPATCTTGIAGQTDTAHSLFVVSRSGSGASQTESVVANPATVGAGKLFESASFQRDFRSGGSCTLDSASTTRCNNDTTTYSTGSKDTLGIANGGWQCGNSQNVNNKVDINNAYVSSYWTGPTHAAGDGDHILYAGIEKEKNNGTNDIGVWFLQGSASCSSTGANINWSGTGHRNGDVLVVSEFSNGGGVSTVKTFTWRASTDPTSPFFGDGGCIDSRVGQFNPKVNGGCNLLSSGGGGDCKSATPTDTTCATTNANATTGGAANPYKGTVSTPWLASDATLGVGNDNVVAPDFIEVGIDVTQLFAGTGESAPSCFNVGVPDTRSAASVTATLFDYVVNKIGECGSKVQTTPKDGSGNDIPAAGLSIGTDARVHVSDHAVITVNGFSGTFHGTVQFSLCGPLDLASTSNCASGGVAIGSPVGVNGSAGSATVDAPDTVLTSVGRYCWRAEYSGDGDVPASSDPKDANDTSTTECFKIVPVTPTLVTSASGNVTLGTAITDTATLGGTAKEPGTGGVSGGTINAPAASQNSAGGTITIKVFGPDSCTTSAHTDFTLTVNSGDATYGPVSFTPTATGLYVFVASYGGDPVNTNAQPGVTCANQPANEKVVVSSSSVVTTPSGGTAARSITTAGSISVTDSATVTVNGATTWSGNVRFHLCGPDDLGSQANCSTGGTLIGADKPVTNTAPTNTSDAATITKVGKYCWRGDFLSGTTGVPNSSDPANGTTLSECFTVTPVTPTLNTQANGPTIVLGNPITDTATLAGTANEPGSPVINPTTVGGPAQGTITIKVFGPDSCTTSAHADFTVSVNGDGTYGPVSFTPTAIGVYVFVASYGGDSPNTNAQPGVTCANQPAAEKVTVIGNSHASSVQNWLPNDSVTLTADSNLNGNLTITLYPGGSCSAGGTVSAVPNMTFPITVTNGDKNGATYTTTNTTFTVSTVGLTTWSWLVHYHDNVQTSPADSCTEVTNLTIANQ